MIVFEDVWEVVWAVVILGLSYLWIDKGLMGIGLALIIGRGVVSLFYFILNLVRRRLVC